MRIYADLSFLKEEEVNSDKDKNMDLVIILPFIPGLLLIVVLLMYQNLKSFAFFHIKQILCQNVD